MDVGCVILGRPWLFDMDVTLYGRSNMCMFEFQGKKIKFIPRAPRYDLKKKEKVDKTKSAKRNKSKGLHIIRPREFEQKLKKDTTVYTVVSKEVPPEFALDCPPKVEHILVEFKEMFPKDLPDQLPPMHDIQHAIDLVPGANFPDLPRYRMNPTEHVELKRQVDELLRKGFIRENEPMCHACSSHT